MIAWNFHPGHNPRWCGEYWPDDDDTGAPWGVCWVAETASLLTGELGKMKEKALDLLVRDAREALSA